MKWLILLTLFSCSSSKLSQYNITDDQLRQLANGTTYQEIVGKYQLPPKIEANEYSVRLYYPNDHYKWGNYYCRNVILEFDHLSDDQVVLVDRYYERDIGDAALRCLLYSFEITD